MPAGSFNPHPGRPPIAFAPPPSFVLSRHLSRLDKTKEGGTIGAIGGQPPNPRIPAGQHPPQALRPRQLPPPPNHRTTSSIPSSPRGVNGRNSTPSPTSPSTTSSAISGLNHDSTASRTRSTRPREARLNNHRRTPTPTPATTITPSTDGNTTSTTCHLRSPSANHRPNRQPNHRRNRRPNHRPNRQPNPTHPQPSPTTPTINDRHSSRSPIVIHPTGIAKNHKPLDDQTTQGRSPR